MIFANWPTTEPTAPEAAATTSVSPGLGWPMFIRPVHAVIPGIPSTPSAVVTGAKLGIELPDAAAVGQRVLLPAGVGIHDVPGLKPAELRGVDPATPSRRP